MEGSDVLASYTVLLMAQGDGDHNRAGSHVLQLGLGLGFGLMQGVY